MSLVEQIQAEINQLKSQISSIPLQTRTLRIERTNCISLGSQYAAKSAESMTCREIPIIESFYNPQDQNTVSELNNQIAIKQTEIQNILNDIAEKAKALLPRNTDPVKLNDTASSPNALSLGIPTIILIAGIVGLLILGRKN